MIDMLSTKGIKAVVQSANEELEANLQSYRDECKDAGDSTNSMAGISARHRLDTIYKANALLLLAIKELGRT